MLLSNSFFFSSKVRDLWRLMLYVCLSFLMEKDIRLKKVDCEYKNSQSTSIDKDAHLIRFTGTYKW